MKVNDLLLFDVPQYLNFDELIIPDAAKSIATLAILMHPELLESLLTQGYIKTKPIWVSKSDEGYALIDGRTRVLILYFLKTEDPERFQRLLPDGKIPAWVFDGSLIPEAA